MGRFVEAAAKRVACTSLPHRGVSLLCTSLGETVNDRMFLAATFSLEHSLSADQLQRVNLQPCLGDDGYLESEPAR